MISSVFPWGFLSFYFPDVFFYRGKPWLRHLTAASPSVTSEKPPVADPNECLPNSQPPSSGLQVPDSTPQKRIQCAQKRFPNSRGLTGISLNQPWSPIPLYNRMVWRCTFHQILADGISKDVCCHFCKIEDVYKRNFHLSCFGFACKDTTLRATAAILTLQEEMEKLSHF